MMKKEEKNEYKYSYESDGKMGNNEEEKEFEKKESEHDPSMFFNATQHSE
ncbi:hypothetical protein [Bacillus kexueae]|nr:hypothetical protein [Bacillus kexueae]